jgi:hypothetical protein
MLKLRMPLHFLSVYEQMWCPITTLNLNSFGQLTQEWTLKFTLAFGGTDYRNISMKIYVTTSVAQFSSETLLFC